MVCLNSAGLLFEFADGCFSLNGKFVLNRFTLPPEQSWSEVADPVLPLLAGPVDVDCEAECKAAEAVF